MNPSQGNDGRSAWELLQALFSHRQRLCQRLSSLPLDRSIKNAAMMKSRIFHSLFDTSMRQIMENRDLFTIIEREHQKKPEVVQSTVEEFCSLLNQLVNLELVSNRDKAIEKTSTMYQNLSLLTEMLRVTDWHFEVVSGTGNALFKIGSLQEATKAHQLAYRFKTLFSHVAQIDLEKVHEETTTSSWRLRKELRDKTVRGLRTLMLESSQSNAVDCNGHKVLIRLPDWKTYEEAEEGTVLDLFLSICSDSNEWHAASCVVQSTIPIQQPPCAFCQDLMDARSMATTFRFAAGDGQLYMPPEGANGRPTDPNHHPRTSLHSLINGYSFLDARTYCDSLPSRRTKRFYRRQKRALAASLALCMSLYLDSEYTLNAFDSQSVMFISDNPDYPRDLAYVTSDINKKWKCDAFDCSMPLYTSLATLLLEIEYGISQEGKTLEDITHRVDYMIRMNMEDLESECGDDLIDIREIVARKMYLEAVRDLLKFDITYRRRSRYLTWKVLDTDGDSVGTIAREIIFTEIAQKIRDTIEPRNLEISGIPSLQEDTSTQVQAQAKPSKPTNVSRTAVVMTKRKESTKLSAIQLFDDKEEISSNIENSRRADAFFEQLKHWHRSCDEYAIQIQRLRSSSADSLSTEPKQLVRDYVRAHKRIRIAVLDTGIDRNNGRIRGGILLDRIKSRQWNSWIGGDSRDIRDLDGHGTRVAEVILRAAPEADIFIGKVFSASEFSTKEAKNIAKAINHAVTEWDVDIISMSFGLQPLTSSDEELRGVYREIEDAISNAGDKIFFSAAANHGGHAPRTFPATDRNVICIHASDGHGNDAGINPNPQEGDLNFMTLGSAVDFGDVRRTGTSYATPIAAGVAAQTLYIADSLLRLTPIARRRLRTGDGMRAMLSLMSEKRPIYRFVAPWQQLWKRNWQLDDDQIQLIETTILTTSIFKH